MNPQTKLFVIEDSQLVEQAKSGDASAFGELVRRYQMDVRAFLLRRINDKSRADDLAQEVFLGAMNSIERFKQTSSVRSWLITIARYKLIDFLRSETRRKKKTADFEIALESESLRRLQDNDNYDDDELIAVLRLCIKKLKPNAKRILDQYYFDGMAATEIARQSKQKPSTVRMTLLRIRRALSKCLKKRLGEKLEL